MAELADALDLGSSGKPCRFKSCLPHHSKYMKCGSGSVVEHRLAKARVAGSNPVFRSIYDWAGCTGLFSLSSRRFERLNLPHIMDIIYMIQT